jgi:hypothetical protein
MAVLVMGYPVFSVTVPQFSVTVGAMNEEVGLAGLHPKDGIVAIPVKTGLTRSLVQLMVCTNALLSFPHPSTNIHVRVWMLVQPVVTTVLVTGYPDFSAGIPQSSVAVGDTKAFSGFAGLQPR